MPSFAAAGISLSTYLGGVSSAVTPGVAVGITRPVGELLEQVQEYLEQGYLRIKLKVEPGWDLEPVQAVRERFGPDLMLQVDANGSYRRSDLPTWHASTSSPSCLSSSLCTRRDLLGHAQLAEHLTTPICLDESIVSARSAASADRLRACSVVNIKAGRVGGYLEARAVHDLCLSADVPVWCGGMLETGLGRAANLALASLPGFSLPGDISASDRYFHQDITTPFRLSGGQISVPTGPGLGVEVLLSVIDELTVRSKTVSGLES